MDILGFFLSPTGLGVVALVVVCIFIVFMLKRMKPSREVMYLRERDRRGQRFGINEETAISLVCRLKRGIDKRFFKWAGSYVFNEGGKMITRFLGKEGTAYTYKPKQPEGKVGNPGEIPSTKLENVQCLHCGEVFETELPVVKMGQIGERLGSLGNALKNVWGDEFYNEVPEERRKEVEDSKILVTVDLEPGLTPPGYSPVSEEDINEEQDREAAKIFGKGLGATTKQQLYQGMLWMALGIAITFILYNIGIFK